MKKKIIIFGATSKVAMRLIGDYLIKTNFELIAVGRKSTDYFNQIGIKYIQGDIRNSSLFESLPKDNIFAVYNFAGVQPSILNMTEKDDHRALIQEYIDVNIKGVADILEYCKVVNANRYIFTDSHRVYENYWENGRFITSDMPVNINYSGDHSMYAISKYTSVMISEYYKSFFGIKTFVFRLPMIYGLSETDTYLVNGQPKRMPWLSIIKQAMDGIPLEVWGDPMMKKDYVSIHNAAQILYKALIAENDGGEYIIGTGEAVTTEEFIKTIASVFSPKGENHEIVYKPQMKAYKCAIYDMSKEKAELGYDPDNLRTMLIKIKNEMESTGIIEKWGW